MRTVARGVLASFEVRLYAFTQFLRSTNISGS